MVAGLIELINLPESKLNHLSLSYMWIGFKGCQQLTEAVAKSDSLCALHISGNRLNLQHKRFLCRILSIPEGEIETSEDTRNRISTDEIRNVLSNELDPSRSNTKNTTGPNMSRGNSRDANSRLSQNRVNIPTEL